MSGDDRMLERVRRLLSKAEGAATEAERDAYNAKAAELIARYGIEEALLARGNRPPAAGRSGRRARRSLCARQGVLAVSGRRPPGSARGLVQRPQRGGHPLSMHLFGMSSDLERVDLLYTSLLVQAAHGLAVARPADPYESVAAYRRSWMIGFAYTIQQRLVAAEQAAASEPIARTRPSA